MFAGLPGLKGGAKREEPSSPRTYEEIRAYVRRSRPKPETIEAFAGLTPMIRDALVRERPSSVRAAADRSARL